MRTLGVDLSADVGKIAVCLVDWRACRVMFLDRPVSDAQIVSSILAVDIAGMDVPLGWPDAFVEALVAHRSGHVWPPALRADASPPQDRIALRYRKTDLVVRSIGAQPLSVSTDRIGVAAMRAARILHLLAEAGVPADRSGVSGQVAEVYPAGALRSWGLTYSGYKGRKNRDACRTLTTLVAESCGALTEVVRGALGECDDDDLDAFICAVVARAARQGQTGGPTGEQLVVARREGWIHLPTVGIGEVVAP